MALVASLQKTSNEIPEEVQVLLWEGYLQLLETSQETIGSTLSIFI